MKKPYQIELQINEDKLKADGDTLLEAINGLNPTFYKTKGNIVVKYGKKKAEKLLFVPEMRRLFGNDMMKELMVKRLTLLMK